MGNRTHALAAFLIALTLAAATSLATEVTDNTNGYTGNTTGTWRADIDASTGLISNASNDGGGAGLGSITRIGTGTQRASATLTTATSMRFEGGIDAGAAMTGTWSNPLGASGTFTGQRTSMASGCP